MLSELNIRRFLELTILEAEKAFEEGNYPIGSILVDETSQIVSTKRNQCKTEDDLTAHAEILNLREIGMSYKSPLTLFTSLEPCFGCSFFIARSSVSNIYSCLKDPHLGGTSDLQTQKHFEQFFNKIEVINEPYADLADKSRKLMAKYFSKIGRLDKAKYYQV